jgi:CheY-like chemotaxis protein
VSGETILIVDDNAVNLKLARVLLTALGYCTLTAVDADDALARLRERRPELILMDLQLPGTDGFALTRQLKDSPDTRAIPIVALTAYAMKGDDERARAAGCDGYVTKPIDAQLLTQAIEGCLARSRGDAPSGGGLPPG